MMWVSKLESDDLNPVFKHILTWTDLFVIGVFVKFGWVKQHGKTPGSKLVTRNITPLHFRINEC